MTTTVGSDAGTALFARYAFPPHELGYCGPPDADGLTELGRRVREFDGAWPYLEALADSGTALDEHAVRAYWVGGDRLAKVDSTVLLRRLRTVFAHQNPGALDRVDSALAHHSFHVFAVYPWVRFLPIDSVTALSVLQRCRIRWGTVRAIEDDHVIVESQQLVFVNGALGLGEPGSERIRWRHGARALTDCPRPGGWVSAHWDWICDCLTAAEVNDLDTATRRSLSLVNDAMTRTA